MRESSWRAFRRTGQPGFSRVTRSVAAVALVFTVDCWRLSDPQDISFRPGEMPGCDQAAATRLLKRAFANSPPERLRSVAVLGVTSIAENGEQGDDRRTCSGTVFTNAGNYLVNYTIEWVDAASKNEIRLQGDVLSRYL